jgi:hypothetical protein
MAGKSSVMRSVLYAALLQNQGLPQTGAAQVPFGLLADTPIGSERQGVDKSLLSSAITGLHRIAGLGDIENQSDMYVWAIDEMGRRTNKHFGESLFLTSLILSSLKGNGTNYVVSATHYHNLERFSPFLKELGITPQWFSVTNHRLHTMKAGETTQSLAIASLAKYIPLSELQTWPDSADLQRVYREGVTPMESDNTISRGRVEEITYADLFGSGRRAMEYSVGELLGGADDRTVFIFDKVFLKNIDDGKKAQALFKNLIDSSFASRDDTIQKVAYLLEFYSPDGERISAFEFHDAERKLYESMFGINPDLSASQWRVRANAALKHLNRMYTRAINSLETSVRDSGFENFSTKGMQKGITVQSLSDPTGASTWKNQLAFAKGVIAYTRKITGPSMQFHPVTYLDTPQVSMKDAFNPYLPAKKVVPNDVEIDFTGETAGTFISGENYSGKSNYIRTVALALWLARTTGYAPAAEINMHPDILPLSLTQPVSDEIGASSMAVESRDRLRPAYTAANGVRGAYIVSLLDEPGAPTSPEDAGKSIRWLFRKYWQNHRNAKLIVTSHCDDVPQLLELEQIPVELSAFRLLSKDARFKKIPGTVDSNALEVARELGLHPLIYEFAVCIHQYIKEVDAKTATPEVMRQYAMRIRVLLHAIEAIPRDAKWQR